MNLITGATGLLGSEIINISAKFRGHNSKSCDLLDPTCYELDADIDRYDIKTVIHCAARVGGVKANSDYVADFFDENIKINMNVLNICKIKKVKLMSVLSTCVYPDVQYVKYPLTEDQLHNGPPHFSNFGYAYAKRMLEVQSRAYRKQYGCNFISVIPNNLYGPNDNYSLESSHVIPALIRKFYEAHRNKLESVSVWGTGNPLREFTFAKDAAEIILWLTENYNEEEPVNIGNPEQISIKELAQIISDEIGFKGKIMFDTSKPDGQYQKPSSNQKLRDLGWNGQYTPLKDGLKQTIDHFKLNYPNLRGV